MKKHARPVLTLMLLGALVVLAKEVVISSSRTEKEA